MLCTLHSHLINQYTAMENSTNNDATAQHQLGGIDIRDALNILSNRTPHEHHDCGDKDSRGEAGHGCCRGGADNPLPAEMKNMGQTIDLFAPSKESSESSQQSSSPSETTAVTAGTNNNSIQQQQKLRESLRDLPIVDLLRMVLKCQEDRVKAYFRYSQALKTVLLSRKLTDYPPACLSATAAFSVLSDTVMAIRDEVSTRIENKNDTEKKFETSIVRSICELQSSEREKLQLTAAFHLECLRASNLKQEDQRELQLLNSGQADLRSRIETCKTNINDILDDLRCGLTEKLEEEEEKKEAGRDTNSN